MLLAPASAEEMRALSMLSAVTMAVLIGGRFLGRHAFAVRLVFTVIYIAALLGFAAWRLIGGPS